MLLRLTGGHTATVLRTFAQIQQSRTSYIRRTLGDTQGKNINYS